MSRNIQFALFFGFATVLLTAIHAYLWLRLVKDVDLASPLRQIAATCLAALLLSVPLSLALDRVLPSGFLRTVGVIPFVWMGAMVLFVFWFGAADLARLVLFAVSKIAGLAPMTPERRLFLSRASALAGLVIVAVLTVVAVWTAARDPLVTTVSIRLPHLPRALDGFKIAQISDLHLGGSRNDGVWTADVVQRVNALAPDLIAVTGDLVDAPPEHIRELVAPLAALEARHGVYFVTGNHEFYAGLAVWLPEIRRLGMRVLRNERVAIGTGAASFDLLGVDDPGHGAGGGGTDLARAVAGRDPERAAVLLAHQPKIAVEAAARGVGLVLSGHTHGGQIWPFSVLVRLQQPFLRGVYPLELGATLFVTDGTGHWGPPMRLCTRNEIALIVLRASETEG